VEAFSCIDPLFLLQNSTVSGQKGRYVVEFLTSLTSLFPYVERSEYRTLFSVVTGRHEIVESGFYRAMHFSAKRGIAIACRLSVCLSVCNVGEL